METLTEILRKYDGENERILYYKKKDAQHLFIPDTFAKKYILSNYKYKPVEVNRIVRITSDFGTYLQEQNRLEFTPTRLRITKIIGEIDNKYHCYAQYRQSVPPRLMYVSKNHLITPVFEPKTYSTDGLDLSKYDKEGRMLKEHQKEGIKFLLEHRKCILADQQGLGKTLQATIATIEGGFERILVVTTASLKTTWRRELSYYVDKQDIGIVESSDWVSGKKYTIINYDILKNFYQIGYEEYEYYNRETGEIELKTRKSRKKSVVEENLSKSPLFLEKFDCIIIDEAQKLSNRTSIRYKVISDYLMRANPEAVFLLTGTPLTNRPMNLYQILKLLNADVACDYNYYSRRYCDGRKIRLKTGKEIILTNGATNLDELAERIKHIYIRRLQSEIPGMVGKTVLTREYDLNAKQLAEYNALWDEYLEAQAEKGKYDVDKYRDLVEGIIVRQYLAKEMIPNTIELTDSQVDYGEKVIIVCTFQEEIDLLHKHYGKRSVIYNGKMDLKAKDMAVEAFMNDPSVMVFIANLTAVSVGLSLTSSHFLIFNSYSWQAAENNQAMDRIYRLTQTKDVTCIYQLFTDSISKDMFEKVMRKEEIMQATIKAESEK